MQPVFNSQNMVCVPSPLYVAGECAEISQDFRRVSVEIDLGTNKSLKFILTGPKRWIGFVSFIY